MSVINSIPLIAAGDDGYQISRSVRLRSSASAYFNRTPASASNRKTWTWSGWVKRGTLGTDQQLFGADSTTGGGGVPRCALQFNAANQLDFGNNTAGSAWVNQTSTSVYRDTSSWYHIVCAIDTTQATSTNRVKLYVNGVQLSAFSVNTLPAQNDNTAVNSTGPHNIGRYQNNGSAYFDGYLTEVNFIDGQALTPSSFGETDTITGVWKPKKYAGTYGTNGFYLNFSDNSAATAAAIGKDSSGNGNNWTPNNISVTSGVTYDSMLDVPTMWADGGNGRGNYCVINPLKKPSTATITAGNLDVTWTVTGGEQPASFAQSSGKWYWEQTQNAGFAAPGIILDTAVPSANSITQGYHYYGGNGQFYTAVSGVAYGATFTTGDVIGVALDLDNLQITFYKNNVSQGTKTIAAGSYNPDIASAGTITVNANFGQRPFAYTPPTGFKALNTQNLPDATIKKGNAYFDVLTATGSGSYASYNFSPDFVWLKARGSATNHQLFDKSRGAGNQLSSNTTGAETANTNGLSAFVTNGYTLGSDWTGVTHADWVWKESASAGFDIVTYTGNGSTQNVSHSLGVAPSLIIVKRRDTGSSNWIVYSRAAWSSGNYLILNATDAISSVNAVNTFGNNSITVQPNSTVFTVGSGANMNANSGTFVAYLFAEVAGYSKFGSFTGNGSADGPFVYLGFRPKFVMIKCSSNGGQEWILIDTSRNTYNSADNYLYANSSAVEGSVSSYFDILSNGFKPRAAYTTSNASGYTYIYMAFAENPFKNSLAR